MPSFKVTPEEVSQASSSCYSTAETLQQQLASLKLYVVNLETVWGGIASNTFQELMQLYDTCSASLHQALTDIGSGLNGNFVNYTDSEQANLKTITAIDNELSTANLG